MLVLTRKRFEMIQIGDDVVIKVFEMNNHWVKIGIEAPDEVRVVRAELFGKPGPQHPLNQFLKQRRAEKDLKSRNSQINTSAADRVRRFDDLPCENRPHERRR